MSYHQAQQHQEPFLTSLVTTWLGPRFELNTILNEPTRMMFSSEYWLRSLPFLVASWILYTNQVHGTQYVLNSLAGTAENNSFSVGVMKPIIICQVKNMNIDRVLLLGVVTKKEIEKSPTIPLFWQETIQYATQQNISSNFQITTFYIGR